MTSSEFAEAVAFLRGIRIIVVDMDEAGQAEVPEGFTEKLVGPGTFTPLGSTVFMGIWSTWSEDDPLDAIEDMTWKLKYRVSDKEIADTVCILADSPTPRMMAVDDGYVVEWRGVFVR